MQSVVQSVMSWCSIKTEAKTVNSVKLVTHQLKGRERLRINGKLTEIR